MRLVPLFVLLLLAMPALAAQQVEIIELRHRTVEDVMPVLEPLLEPGGAMSGMNGQLILRASERNLAELKKVLAVIDRPPRQLIVRVTQSRDTASRQRDLDAAGSLQIGNGVRIVLPGGAMPGGAGVEVRSGGSGIGAYGRDVRRETSAETDQFVRVMDGGEAFIRVGRALAVPFRRVEMRPGGARASEGVVYVDIGEGFSAVPRLTGDRVTIEISPRSDRAARRGLDVETQGLSTTVTGRVGEWIELGGSAQQAGEEAAGLTGASSGQRRDTRSVWLLVEEVR